MKTRIFPAVLFSLILMTLTACNKAILYSRDREMEPVSRAFSTSIPEAFKASKEVLLSLGYKIESEDESAGNLKTGWQSTKAGSHYVDLFDRRDYGTVGAYYQIQIRVTDQSGKAQVEVAAPVRSIVGRIKSSHSEEGRILRKIADLLRREDFEMTNVGVQE